MVEEGEEEPHDHHQMEGVGVEGEEQHLCLDLPKAVVVVEGEAHCFERKMEAWEVEEGVGLRLHGLGELEAVEEVVGLQPSRLDDQVVEVGASELQVRPVMPVELVWNSVGEVQAFGEKSEQEVEEVS